MPKNYFKNFIEDEYFFPEIEIKYSLEGDYYISNKS